MTVETSFAKQLFASQWTIRVVSLTTIHSRWNLDIVEYSHCCVRLFLRHLGFDFGLLELIFYLGGETLVPHIFGNVGLRHGRLLPVFRDFPELCAVLDLRLLLCQVPDTAQDEERIVRLRKHLWIGGRNPHSLLCSRAKDVDLVVAQLLHADSANLIHKEVILKCCVRSCLIMWEVLVVMLTCRSDRLVLLRLTSDGLGHLMAQWLVLSALRRGFLSWDRLHCVLFVVSRQSLSVPDWWARSSEWCQWVLLHLLVKFFLGLRIFWLLVYKSLSLRHWLRRWSGFQDVKRWTWSLLGQHLLMREVALGQWLGLRTKGSALVIIGTDSYTFVIFIDNWTQIAVVFFIWFNCFREENFGCLLPLYRTGTTVWLLDHVHFDLAETHWVRLPCRHWLSHALCKGHPVPCEMRGRESRTVNWLMLLQFWLCLCYLILWQSFSRLLSGRCEVAFSLFCTLQRCTVVIKKLDVFDLCEKISLLELATLAAHPFRIERFFQSSISSFVQIFPTASFFSYVNDINSDNELTFQGTNAVLWYYD